MTDWEVAVTALAASDEDARLVSLGGGEGSNSISSSCWYLVTSDGCEGFAGGIVVVAQCCCCCCLCCRDGGMIG